MSVSEIGFYTLTDDRAKLQHTNLERCEMILTEACNFKCPYCRGVESYSRDCSGNMDYKVAEFTLKYWIEKGLKNIRFSGGEPTLYPHLFSLINIAKNGGIDRIAISTNGSMRRNVYESLLACGVNDFSISLDACCVEDADKMAGREGYFETVVENIRWLSKETYVTVGLVFTDERASEVAEVVKFAASLGVSDIRIIPAAQYDGSLLHLEKIDQELLDKYPVLKYRVSNLLSGRNVRGLKDSTTNKCYLVRDDYAVAGKWHFSCVIHMREGGEPIGEIGPNMQQEREEWSRIHDTHSDPICIKNCLDCLVDYNNLADSSR